MYIPQCQAQMQEYTLYKNVAQSAAVAMQSGWWLWEKTVRSETTFIQKIRGRQQAIRIASARQGQMAGSGNAESLQETKAFGIDRRLCGW